LKGFSAVDNQGFYEKVLLKSSRGFFYCCFLLSVTQNKRTIHVLRDLFAKICHPFLNIAMNSDI